MIDLISTGLSSLNSAHELLKALDGAKTTAAILDVKLDLQRHLLTAHQALFDAQQSKARDAEAIRALEAEIVKLKEWDAEAEGYELADTGRGALAYRLKGTEPDSESGHWLCPNCFTNRKKSLLIPQNHGPWLGLHCHPCKLEIVAMGRRLDTDGPRGRR